MRKAWRNFCEVAPEIALVVFVWVAALTGLALLLPWIAVGIDRYFAWVGTFLN